MSTNATSLISNTAIAEPMTEVNMTPLIDVMLVLIIMLIITIPKQNHATTLALPSGDSSSVAKPAVVQLDVDFDGTILWNGEVVLNRGELTAKLTELARATTPTELHVRPSKLAPYKAVAGVLAVAQRSGVLNMGVVGNEQYL